MGLRSQMKAAYQRGYTAGSNPDSFDITGMGDEPTDWAYDAGFHRGRSEYQRQLRNLRRDLPIAGHEDDPPEVRFTPGELA